MRILIWFFVMLLSVSLQSTVVPVLSFGGVRPDFVLVVTGRPQPWSTIVGPGLQVVTTVPSALPRDGRSIMAIIDMPATKVPRADIPIPEDF